MMTLCQRLWLVLLHHFKGTGPTITRETCACTGGEAKQCQGQDLRCCPDAPCGRSQASSTLVNVCGVNIANVCNLSMLTTWVSLQAARETNIKAQTHASTMAAQVN